MPTRREVLSASVVTAAGAAVAPLVMASSAAAGEPHGRGPEGPGRPYRPQPPDRELRRALREIDVDNIRAIIEKLVSFGTRHTLSSQDDPARGIGAARDWIFQTLQGYAATSGGRMTVRKQAFVQPVANRIPTPTVITNVIATLPGDTAPDRVYVVSGHYDSRVTDIMNFTSDAPGADDDASGVAVIMEMARVMSTRHTEATIMFCAVAGEEQGLYGSAFLAQQLKAANTDVQGMFSNDIVGTGVGDDGSRDPHRVRMFTEGVPTAETPAQASNRQLIGGENDSNSRQLGRFALSVAQNDATGMAIWPIWRRDRYLRGSDHISFLQQGYPAGRITEPREDYHREHQDVRVENGLQFGDRIEACDFDYIARVARVNLATYWSLAQAPGTPKNTRILAAVLTNDSTLLWDAGTEPDLAGYEVVWRETSAPDWQHAIPVGNVTQVTINLVKDNVMFGVRAVDRDGHRSPVAFPVPANA
ncbi:MAG: M28 family peptidase [Mycobacteriales bacterium]